MAIIYAFTIVLSAVLMNTGVDALQGSTYRAAVLEHAVVFPYPWATNRAMALEQMMVNLKIYEEHAHIAGKEVSWSYH